MYQTHGLNFRSKCLSSVSIVEFSEETESAGEIANKCCGLMFQEAGCKTLSRF